MSNTVSNLTVVDTTVAPKYDDPYEENPVIVQCLCNGNKQKSAESDVTAETPCDSCEVSIEQEMSNCTSAGVIEQNSECKNDAGCSAMPVRSFELSAEYGGFFVVPAVTEQSNNKGAHDYTDQQAVVGQPVSLQMACADSSVGGTGLYDKPWDLCTVKRSIKERLHQSSQKDVGRAVVDNCRPTSTDVYAQPHKGEKRHYRIATDPRITKDPSYGVLCERLCDNGFNSPPPLAQRQAGIRNNQPDTWTTDSRPVDDYDVPWDQKKKFGGHIGKKQIYFLYKICSIDKSVQCLPVKVACSTV